MFYRHSSVGAIAHHLRGIEYELNRMGRMAGRQTSARVSTLRDQLAEIVTPILNEVSSLLRSSPEIAREATRLGNQAMTAGARLGNQALARMPRHPPRGPLVILALALGCGILIALSGRHRSQS
jgi:hypothetical protein